VAVAAASSQRRRGTGRGGAQVTAPRRARSGADGEIAEEIRAERVTADLERGGVARGVAVGLRVAGVAAGRVASFRRGGVGRGVAVGLRVARVAARRGVSVRRGRVGVRLGGIARVGAGGAVVVRAPAAAARARAARRGRLAVTAVVVATDARESSEGENQ